MDNNCVKYYQDPTWQWGVMARTRILGMCALWPWPWRYENPSSGSWEEVENVKSLRTTDGALWQKLTWAFGSGELKRSWQKKYPCLIWNPIPFISKVMAKVKFFFSKVCSKVKVTKSKFWFQKIRSYHKKVKGQGMVPIEGLVTLG